jgi:hypothetical protein
MKDSRLRAATFILDWMGSFVAAGYHRGVRGKGLEEASWAKVSRAISPYETTHARG